jgi:hypothetical protein
VLLLIAIYDRPLFQVLQTEQFAGEVIRTLIGSIGLVLAVPLTTAVGVAVVRASRSARVAPSARTTGPPEPIDSLPAEAETGLLPATKWRAQRSTPGPPEAEAKPAESSRGARHRSRRRDDDDFGDFTYLRDPTDTDPGGPTGNRGR